MIDQHRRLAVALVAAALGIVDVAIPARACTDVGVPGVACDDTATTNLIEENDSFIDHHDLHYTQGLRFSFASSEQTPGDSAYPALRAVADAVFLPDRLEGELRYGLFVGQSLFTPQNLALTVPDPRDRPYAGWLYGGVSVYRDTGDHLDRADVTLGLVGPGAAGAAVQNNWHREAPLPALRGMHANGWSAQLRDEPGLILSEQRQWRLAAAAGPIELDALPEVNASVGNIFTYAAAGGLLRIGQGLGVDWGQPRIEPALSGSDFVNRSAIAGRWGAWYLFGGIEGRAVARNIFLDGNSFEHSAHVGKRPFVADFTGGFMAYLWAARFSVSYTRRTREFTTQLKQDEFVSVLLAINF
jgi:lipid A 3-O-deacylase